MKRGNSKTKKAVPAKGQLFCLKFCILSLISKKNYPIEILLKAATVIPLLTLSRY